jgi:hypothetical protein
VDTWHATVFIPEPRGQEGVDGGGHFVLKRRHVDSITIQLMCGGEAGGLNRFYYVANETQTPVDGPATGLPTNLQIFFIFRPENVLIYS